MSGLRHVAVESRDIPIGDLFEPEYAARTEMDEAQLDELAANIRLNGVLQPLIVFPVVDGFEVAAGHRRARASKRAGLTHVPCRVYVSPAAAMEAAKDAENRYREKLGAADEARYFQRLLERDHGGDTEQLAAALGLRRDYVETSLLLLRGDAKVLAALDQKTIKKGVALALNECNDELHRRMLLHEAIARGATVALVESWIADWKAFGEAATRHLRDHAPAAVATMQLKDDFHTCAACGDQDNKHTMRPLMFHDVCVAAVLTKALERWNRRHEYVAWPRTLDEAVELVNELTDRFPGLAGEPSSS